MNGADQIILTVTNTTSEVYDTEAGEDELDNQNSNGNLQQCDTCVKMEILNFFQLLYEVSFFLHEPSLLFRTMLLHLVTNFLKMGVAENVFIVE